jgi:hypothetical protein
LTATDRAARAVFALLVAACFAAFFVTQRLKHTPTAVQMFKMTPSFSPSSSGADKQERISFRLARSDEVTVTIVDSAGSEVATLTHEVPVTGYKQFSLRWNGRLGPPHGYALVSGRHGRVSLLPANLGAVASAGDYRVRVSLHRQRRAVLSPRSFTLVRR